MQELFESEERNLLRYSVEGDRLDLLQALKLTRSLRTQLLESYEEALSAIDSCS